MKTSSKSAVAMALVLAMGTAAWAFAREGMPQTPGSADGKDASCPEKFGRTPHGDRAALMDKRLSELHSDLKLTVEQEAAWNEWSGQVRKHIAEMKDKRPDFSTMQNLPAPDRMEKWLAFAKERQVKLEEGLAATKTFYAGLSSDQQKVFDQKFDLLKPGGWKGRHHRQQ